MTPDRVRIGDSVTPVPDSALRDTRFRVETCVKAGMQTPRGELLRPLAPPTLEDWVRLVELSRLNPAMADEGAENTLQMHAAEATGG